MFHRPIVRGDAEDKMKSTGPIRAVAAALIPPIPPRKKLTRPFRSPPTWKENYDRQPFRSVPIPQVRYFVTYIVEFILNRVQKNTSECDWSTTKTCL